MQQQALWIQPVPAERVWGGHTIAQRLGVQASAQPIGEMWLAYDQNMVHHGQFEGQTLGQALQALGPDFLGQVPFGRYGLELPLLIKFLDANEWLSVQVHPNDAYAHTVEQHTGFHGKTEAWYILEGEGEIVYGLTQPQTSQALEQAAQDGSIWNMLHRQQVHPEQVVNVPAGTIHALGPGLVLYEVQQRSDLTYRIYDYGRGRELHLQKGLEVSKLQPTPIEQLQPSAQDGATVLLASEAFVLQQYQVAGATCVQAPQESFMLLTVVQGTAQLEGEALGADSSGMLSLPWGQTLLLGAGQSLTVHGQAVLLGAFIPSEQRLQAYPEGVRTTT